MLLLARVLVLLLLFGGHANNNVQGQTVGHGTGNISIISSTSGHYNHHRASLNRSISLQQQNHSSDHIIHNVNTSFLGFGFSERKWRYCKEEIRAVATKGSWRDQGRYPHNYTLYEDYPYPRHGFKEFDHACGNKTSLALRAANRYAWIFNQLPTTGPGRSNRRTSRNTFRWSAKKMCTLLGNKTVVFVGDSMMGQFYSSFVSALLPRQPRCESAAQQLRVGCPLADNALLQVAEGIRKARLAAENGTGADIVSFTPPFIRVHELNQCGKELCGQFEHSMCEEFDVKLVAKYLPNAQFCLTQTKCTKSPYSVWDTKGFGWHTDPAMRVADLLIANRGAHPAPDENVVNEVRDTLTWLQQQYPKLSTVWRNTGPAHYHYEQSFHSPPLPRGSMTNVSYHAYLDKAVDADPSLRETKYSDSWVRFSIQNAAVAKMLRKEFPSVVYLDVFNSSVYRSDSHVDYLHYCSPNSAIDNWVLLLFYSLTLVSVIGHAIVA